VLHARRRIAADRKFAKQVEPAPDHQQGRLSLYRGYKLRQRGGCLINRDTWRTFASLV
jgi:hypothetical protein